MREWADRAARRWSGAVRRQMVSDVPLGSFLSGGIDSSAIVVATMQRGHGHAHHLHGRLHAGGPRPRDRPGRPAVRAPRGRAISASTTTSRSSSPTSSTCLPKLVWHMDEPVADPAAITTYLICSAARERLTVILSGMGGDEIFAGYPRHLAAEIGAAGGPPAGPRARPAPRGRAPPDAGPARTDARSPAQPAEARRGHRRDAVERYLTYCSYYRRDELERDARPDLRGELGGHDPFRRHRDYFDRVEGEHWLNQLLYVDLKTFLPCLNLDLHGQDEHGRLDRGAGSAARRRAGGARRPRSRRS